MAHHCLQQPPLFTLLWVYGCSPEAMESAQAAAGQTLGPHSENRSFVSAASSHAEGQMTCTALGLTLGVKGRACRGPCMH